MNNNFTPKSRKENLVIQELEGEVLIYDLEKNKAFCLNETSALVWQSCDGSRTIADIKTTVGKQLNSQINEDVIWLALDQLSKENLVDKQTPLENKFKGLSRREVIKKVGFASVVALPLVTSLVAPMAANAQSGAVCAGACTCAITGMDAGGTGMVCAPVNTGGCSTTIAGCTCRANDNGNNFSGTCS